MIAGQRDQPDMILVASLVATPPAKKHSSAANIHPPEAQARILEFRLDFLQVRFLRFIPPTLQIIIPLRCRWERCRWELDSNVADRKRWAEGEQT